MTTESDDAQRFELAKCYINASQDASKEYDGRLFWLAGGAIALSAAFAQAVAGHAPLNAVNLLAISWVLLFGGMCIVMVSFQLALRVYELWVKCLLHGDSKAGDTAKEKGVKGVLKMRQLWRFENVPLSPIMTRFAS